MRTENNHTPIGHGGSYYSVTVTFGYRGVLRLVVAPNLREALAEALRRWGEWTTVESISTPETIYADITGQTKACWQPGIVGRANQTEADKLARALGRPPRPGEIGALRRAQSELPTIPRHHPPMTVPFSAGQAKTRRNHWHRGR